MLRVSKERSHLVARIDFVINFKTGASNKIYDSKILDRNVTLMRSRPTVSCFGRTKATLKLRKTLLRSKDNINFWLVLLFVSY